MRTSQAPGPTGEEVPTEGEMTGTQETDLHGSRPRSIPPTKSFEVGAFEKASRNRCGAINGVSAISEVPKGGGL